MTWAILVAVLQDIGLVKLTKDIAAVKMTMSIGMLYLLLTVQHMYIAFYTEYCVSSILASLFLSLASKFQKTFFTTIKP